jgi:hypothetical protein
VLSCCGSWICNPVRCRHLNHTSRAYGHWSMSPKHPAIRAWIAYPKSTDDI